MNIVVNDSKTGKSYTKNIEENPFKGKKIGQEVQLSSIGLEGYKGEIRGGSDKQGFPMKPEVKGGIRRKLLLKKGLGFKKTEIKGQRKKRSVRGNLVTDDTQQINIKITGQGAKPVEEVLGKKEEAKEEKEGKEEKKQ